MPIKLTSNAYAEASNALAQTIMRDDATSGDVDGAIQELASAISDEIRGSFESAGNDRQALASRGFKVLTSEERAYFDRFAKAATAAHTKAEFIDNMDGANLPQTVIDDVMSYVQSQHPFLAALNIRAVSRITKIYTNAGAAQEALWGDLGDAITKEITGAFKELDATQNKLSAYAMISKDELELGPTYLDALIIASLGEAVSNGLEHGFVSGTGLKQPIGFDRSIASGVSVSTTTGYPQKTALAVTDFTPATYGNLLAKLVVDANGRQKNISVTTNAGITTPSFALVTSLSDYLTKIMPATTLLNHEGAYVNGLFPVPTATYTSAYIGSGKALLCIPSEYYALVAANRGLEMSDEYKFLEDKRVYKQVMYGAGQAKDDTSAILLDISALDPAYLNVKVNGTVTTKSAS
jgi:HK97 family phage major capsid protein